MEDDVEGVPRLFGRAVAEFVEQMNGTMPATREWEAIRAGRRLQSKQLPGIGRVDFQRYTLDGQVLFAVVRALDAAFDGPKLHLRLFIDSFAEFEPAATAFATGCMWLLDTATRFRGHTDEAIVQEFLADVQGLLTDRHSR